MLEHYNFELKTMKILILAFNQFYEKPILPGQSHGKWIK